MSGTKEPGMLTPERRYAVTCRTCGQESLFGPRDVSNIILACSQAQKAGWRVVGGYWYCPLHAADARANRASQEEDEERPLAPHMAELLGYIRDLEEDLEPFMQIFHVVSDIRTSRILYEWTSGNGTATLELDHLESVQETLRNRPKQIPAAAWLSVWAWPD